MRQAPRQAVEHYIESKVVDRPCFIIDHPAMMSPLAKYHAQSQAGFELFINGEGAVQRVHRLNNRACSAKV